MLVVMLRFALHVHPPSLSFAEIRLGQFLALADFRFRNTSVDDGVVPWWLSSLLHEVGHQDTVPVELDTIRRIGVQDERTDLVLHGLDFSFGKPVCRAELTPLGRARRSPRRRQCRLSHPPIPARHKGRRLSTVPCGQMSNRRLPSSPEPALLLVPASRSSDAVRTPTSFWRVSTAASCASRSTLRTVFGLS